MEGEEGRGGWRERRGGVGEGREGRGRWESGGWGDRKPWEWRMETGRGCGCGEKREEGSKLGM